jgi:hypothetical protein
LTLDSLKGELSLSVNKTEKAPSLFEIRLDSESYNLKINNSSMAAGIGTIIF